jgi:hypothetical protein
METGFKDRCKVNNPKEKKTFWKFKAPVYDERSSCFVRAGSDYGVGKNQPIGKYEARSMDEVIPKGRVDTLQTDSTDEKNLPFVE